MCRNWRFWLLAVAYCVPIGTYGAFGGIMDIDLNPTGISQVSITATHSQNCRGQRLAPQTDFEG